MSWWGKVIGGTFGFMLGGPLGVLLGAAIGHGFDRGLDRMRDTGLLPGGEADERAQTAFFTATFSVLGHVAKADGRVSQHEIGFAEQLMSQMRLDPAQRDAAIRLFREGKDPDFPLDDVLDQLRAETHRRRNLLRIFVEFQLQAAMADGALDPGERRALLHIAERLGFSRRDFERLLDMLRGAAHARTGDRQTTLADACRVLGVSQDASKEEVKRAYRRLMNQHHPDKLVARGLPEEMVELAKEKTQEIRTAYDHIKRERGWTS